MYEDLIILDFDQTIVDTSKRHFAVFNDLAEKYKVKRLTYEKYWEYRKNNLSNLNVMKKHGFTNGYEKAVQSDWNELIESDYYLKLDKPMAWAEDLLKATSQKHKLWLVSLRSNPDGLIKQVKEFGWYELFDKIIPVKHSVDNVIGKVSAVQYHLKSTHIISGWIGDGPIDKQAANKLGIRFIDVESPDFLSQLQELIEFD